MPRHVLRCLALTALLIGVWCATVATAAGPAAADGAWVWPLDGTRQVVHDFQPPETPYGPGHRGVDLLGAPGSVVRAAGSGTVAYSGVLAGRGVVSLAHADGLRTTYEPVAATVAVGDEVGVGDPIGRLEPGHAGCPVAACLHWGLRRADTYLDPLSLVSSGQVRLYPRYGAEPRPHASGRAPPLDPSGADGADADPPESTTDSAAGLPGLAAAVAVAGAGATVGWLRLRRGG